MNGNRWRYIIIGSAILVGVLYAAPQFFIKQNLEASGKPFVLNQFTELSDEGYFYLQHAREVYDGHFPPKDFFLDPALQRPSIFNIVPPTIFAGFIWLAGGDINAAYIIANLVIVPILFLLLYFIGQYIFKKNNIWSLFLAFVGIFTAAALHTPQFFFSISNFLNIFAKNFFPAVNTLLPKLFLSRIDYPLTAYLIYLPAILVLLYFWQNPSGKKAVALGIFSGLLFHTYFHFWSYWTVILGLAFLYSVFFLYKDKKRWRGFLIAAGIAFIIALPVLINQILLSNLDVTGEFAARVGHLIEHGRTLRLGMWPHYAFYALAAALIWFTFWERDRKKAVLFWIFIGAAVVALNAHLVTGFVPVYRHWVRAFSPLMFILVAALVYEVFQRLRLRYANIGKVVCVVLVGLITLLITKKMVNAMLFINPPPEITHTYTLPKDIVDSFHWLEQYASPEPRIISPSFITSIQLTGLTSARPFLPFSIIASLANQEVESRYLIANKVFGVSPEVLEKRLRGGENLDCLDCVHPYQRKNIGDDESNLYNFYFSDQGFDGIPENKIEELLIKYHNLAIDLQELPADYLYIGPLERVFSNKDFSNSSDFDRVYRNDLVEIYQIKK